MSNLISVTEFRLKLYPKDFIVVRDFYENNLGFPVVKEWDRGENDRGVMFDVGGTILELLSPKNGYKPVAGADISLHVDDVWKLWEAMKDSEEIIFALRDNQWGDTSFRISDPEGFAITFFTKHNNRTT